MIFLEEKNTGRKFAFLNSLRLSILSILMFVLIFLSIWVERPFSYVPLIITCAVAVVLGIANFKLFKWFNHRLVLYFQSFVDITLITTLVYYSGGITSPFYFLYILPIIISAIFLTRKDTIYIATFSYIIFVVLSDLIYLEIISYYPLVPSIDITLNVFIYNSVMSFIAFSGIGILSSYYFVRMRKTGAELRNARENLKDLVLLNNTVLERMENGFIICDTHGIVISYNEKAKTLLKLNNRSNIFDLLNMASNGGKTPDSVPLNKKNYFEQEIETRVLGVSYTIIENIYSFDRVYVFIITDLTEKREIEKKLKQKEHFALIGEMSAGIAHEIRNPLASISGSVQFLSKELKLETEYQHLMDIIVKESARLSNSIEGFLEYARMTPLKETSFDLSHLIDDVTDLVSVNHPGIKLIRKYGPGNTVFADAKKINQVVWNLINNSVKAVDNKGIIEINIYRNENDLYLSIKDNGIGIESSKLERIFLPFHSNFTTGIGLGMSIVKRIIDEHGFDIKINSEKNIGTEVIICFKKS